IVADDGRAAQALEDAHLDFLRSERDQAVEARTEAFHGLTRQPDDEVGVDMDARLRAEEMEVVGELDGVLPPADELAHLVIETLDADLELQCARWKLRNELARRRGQPVGDHLEVDKQAGLISFEEELEDCPAGLEVQIERAIHELERTQSPIEQPLYRHE